LWRNIIVRPDGKIIARKEAYELASHVIAYLIAADKMETEEIEKFRLAYNKARGEDTGDPEKAPQFLPTPIVETATY
jgi:hypothetical protein